MQGSSGELAGRREQKHDQCDSVQRASTHDGKIKRVPNPCWPPNVKCRAQQVGLGGGRLPLILTHAADTSRKRHVT